VIDEPSRRPRLEIERLAGAAGTALLDLPEPLQLVGDERVLVVEVMGAIQRGARLLELARLEEEMPADRQQVDVVRRDRQSGVDMPARLAVARGVLAGQRRQVSSSRILRMR
jgi:hypothetical protein